MSQQLSDVLKISICLRCEIALPRIQEYESFFDHDGLSERECCYEKTVPIAPKVVQKVVQKIFEEKANMEGGKMPPANQSWRKATAAGFIGQLLHLV